MQEQVTELFRLLRGSQEKYAYFLLASVGASIAFALSQTSNATITYYQTPLAFSLVCWGLSFFYGCRHIQQVNSITYSNIDLLRIDGGQHPATGTNTIAIREASAGIRLALEKNVDAASKYAEKQLFFLYCGVLLYIGWHIISMIARTNA